MVCSRFCHCVVFLTVEVRLTPLSLRLKFTAWGKCFHLQMSNNIISRIEESNIVDMIFLHGYNSPTLAIIYEDEVVLLMKTYEIFGRVPALRPIPFSVDSIEPNSKLLIPVPTPHGGVIIVGDNIICYHTRDGPHISQYIPQSKVQYACLR